MSQSESLGVLLLLLFVAAVVIALASLYLLVRLIGYAWYKSKFRYNQKLVQLFNEKEESDVKR